MMQLQVLAFFVFFLILTYSKENIRFVVSFQVPRLYWKVRHVLSLAVALNSCRNAEINSSKPRSLTHVLVATDQSIVHLEALFCTRSTCIAETLWISRCVKIEITMKHYLYNLFRMVNMQEHF